MASPLCSNYSHSKWCEQATTDQQTIFFMTIIAITNYGQLCASQLVDIKGLPGLLSEKQYGTYPKKPDLLSTKYIKGVTIHMTCDIIAFFVNPSL